MKPHPSPIFRFFAGILFVLLNILSVYIFFRGHNLPGGGFIAGACSAMSLILLSLAAGIDAARKVMGNDPLKIATIGLCMAVISASIPLFIGAEFFKNFHLKPEIPVFGQIYLGTPLLFDLGVFLAVVGVITKILFSLTESTHHRMDLIRQEEKLLASPVEDPIDPPVES